LPKKVLVEKMGSPDAGTTARVAEQREVELTERNRELSLALAERCL